MAAEPTGLAPAASAVAVVSLDGESTWLEGARLITVYLVLAIVFYFVPVGLGPAR